MSERKDGMSEHQTIVHTGQAIGWYRCDGLECPICGMNNEAPQKLQRDGMEREARADEVISDWHNWRNCPEDCSGECEACEAYLCKLIAAFAVRCANEARLEALEQAVAAVNRAEKEFDEGGQCEPGCGCWFERIRIALKAEPVPPPKPAREGG